MFGLGTRGDGMVGIVLGGIVPACVLDYPETEDNSVEKGLSLPLIFIGRGEPESTGNIPLGDRSAPRRPSTKHLLKGDCWPVSSIIVPGT